MAAFQLFENQNRTSGEYLSSNIAISNGARIITITMADLDITGTPSSKSFDWALDYSSNSGSTWSSMIGGHVVGGLVPYKDNVGFKITIDEVIGKLLRLRLNLNSSMSFSVNGEIT